MTTEQIVFLQRHYNVDKTAAELSILLGITRKAIMQKVRRLRKRGFEFTEKTYNAPAEIGEVRMWSQGDNVIVPKVKTESGKWVYVKKDEVEKKKRGPKPRPKQLIAPKPKAEKPKPIIQPRPKPFKPMPRKKTNPNLPRQEPKPIKRTTLTDAEKLAIGYQRIKIDDRTWVLRHPDKIKTA